MTAHSSARPALSLDHVTVRYGGDTSPVVNRCSLTVGAGERVALLGSNGSGKTSLLLAAAGVLPHEGEIRVGDVVLDPASADEAREHIGVLFSTPEHQILFPRVLDDVAFALRLRGRPAAEAHESARKTLALLGAEDLAERSPYRLSHGQRLRVALAGALVAGPPLLLLDEPTGGLDPAGRRLLIRQLASLPAAMLIATHDLEFARLCCDRFVLLERGLVRGEGEDFGSVEL